LFHIAQRLCDTQDYEHSVAQQQRRNAQHQVDQYLEKMAIIRERFVDTLAREIQEATLMIMTTLEQFSPITILNNTHELLSPCSMPVPVTSISAIHSTVNEVNHIGSHLHLVSRLLRQEQTCISPEYRDFDIGELIQTVGDALAAMASKIGISVVLYHMDNGLHCINVLGDEDAIKHGIVCVST
jgi:osomolarity two-component system response regulator SSK1